MGGSNSKNSIFDEHPKDYIDIPGEDDYCDFYKKRWRIYLDVDRGYIRVHEYSTFFNIRARRPFPDKQKYEFIYQIKIVNKYHLRRRIVIRGVETLKGTENFCSKTIYNGHWEPSYNQLNFQAVAYAIIEDNGIRKLNFYDADVYGKSTTILTTGGSLEVPEQFINKGAPLLAKYIDKKKPNPKLNCCSEEFFQVFHGVHVQLKLEEIKTLLKFAAKFQVLNVKRYCEQQLIRREDLEVSDKKKFKMACKFSLNILMNQVLRDVKSVKELAKLASIAIEMESMGPNISKLLIGKMRIAVEKLKAFSDLHEDLTFSRVRASRSFPDRGTYEFIYQIIAVNKHHLRKKIVIRGVEELEGTEWFYSEYISNGLRKPKYNRFNFQAVVYAIIEDNGLRKLNFEDTNVYGKSTTVLVAGGSLEVPIQTINQGAPLLAKYIDEKKQTPKLKCSEEFFQVFHGVHVQLKVEEIKSLLKFATIFQVLNVKKYCEQQLIRKKYLKVSEKRKFKMACKFNLNILMNQVLRNVKSVKKLAELASIAFEMKSMNTNISKLLIAKIGSIRLQGYSSVFRIEACRSLRGRRKYEFLYQIIIIDNDQSQRRVVIRGVGKLKGADRFCSITISNGHWKPSYNQFNFQAVVYAIIEINGFRKLNFRDEHVYGESTTILTTGGSSEVPVQTINKGAPLLVKYINKKKPKLPKLKYPEDFFQVFHGVHVQLKIEKIRSLLKFSAKFQVLNVKRYCEHQLIWREDLEVSEKRKFKMACKYNLNILMNQVLRNVKTVRKLAKLASIAIEMESMDSNISKLLIARIYEIF